MEIGSRVNQVDYILIGSLAPRTRTLVSPPNKAMQMAAALEVALDLLAGGFLRRLSDSRRAAACS